MSDAVQIAREIVEGLTREGRTIAVAESLTGGLLAATIVSVPGASACFRGGVVTYATDTKASILGVPQEQLDKTGPVDIDVAMYMAQGAVKLFGADVGLATTGVAGPGPADGHEAGTVFVGAHTPEALLGTDFGFDGDRDDVRKQAVVEALRWLGHNLVNSRQL